MFVVDEKQNGRYYLYCILGNRRIGDLFAGCSNLLKPPSPPPTEATNRKLNDRRTVDEHFARAHVRVHDYLDVIPLCLTTLKRYTVVLVAVMKY